MIIAFVQRILLPVFDINILYTTHQQFKFMFIKYLDKWKRYQTTKTIKECSHLILYS